MPDLTQQLSGAFMRHRDNNGVTDEIPSDILLRRPNSVLHHQDRPFPEALVNLCFIPPTAAFREFVYRRSILSMAIQIRSTAVRLGIYACVMTAGLLMPVEAYAATSLCVEEGSSGFNWEHAEWVQSTFKPAQHIVRKIPLDDGLANGCVQALDRDGLSTEPVKGQYSTTVNACYAMYDVGAEAHFTDVTQCVEYLTDDGSISSVRCEKGGFEQYKFEPSGEFVTTRTYSAPESPKPGENFNRDSLVLAIGKCSVITP